MVYKELAAVLLSGMTLFPAAAQDFNGLDYLRKLTTSYVGKETVKLDSVDTEQYIEYNNFKRPFVDEARNSLEGKAMNIHFQTNKTRLTKHDSIDIIRYVKHVLDPYLKDKEIGCFNIEGFADFRGGDVPNYHLSMKRANSTLNFLKRFLDPTTCYLSVYGGELPDRGNDPLALQKDRVARIIPNENALETALDFCRGDVYLLDQSGSMKRSDSWAWKFLQRYDFVDSVEVYSFSKLINSRGKTIRIQRSYVLDTETPLGITPLFLSLDTLISSVPKNQIITTLINGGDTYGKRTPEDIIKRANEKNIHLNMIGIDLDKGSGETLVKMAIGTGGKYYFLRRFN